MNPQGCTGHLLMLQQKYINRINCSSSLDTQTSTFWLHQAWLKGKLERLTSACAGSSSATPQWVLAQIKQCNMEQQYNF